MANFVLGPGAARRLREMMRGRMASGRVDGDAAHVVDESGFEHPYKLTYAASAGAVDDETGEAAGAWIVWVPPGALVIDGEDVGLAGTLTAASGYPAGWYDLTDIFDGTDPDAFDLYLDASKDDPKFVIAKEDAENPVLIAQVVGKAVKGIVESALVFSKGGNKKPFDIVTVTENNAEVKKIVRCVWMPGGNVVTCQDFTLPTGSAISVYAVVTVTPGQTPSAASTYAFSVQAVDYGEEPEPSSAQGHELDYIFFAPLYDINAAGVVVVDYRDALVTLDWIGVDEVSCSYGGDGNSLSHLHLKDFYNSNSDVSALPQNGAVLARVPGSAGFNVLRYIPLSLIGGGGGGGGGDSHAGDNADSAVGGSGGIFAWTASSGTIGPGGVFVGRKFYPINGSSGNSTNTTYQVQVTFNSNRTISAAVVSGVAIGTAPTATVCYIPIYTIGANGKITADYRGAFVVPCWE